MRARIVVLSALLLSMFSYSPAWAEDDEDEHAAHAPAAAANPGRAMQDIESLMARIAAAPDAAQRKDLLSQHLAAMRAQMRLIRTAHERKAPAAQAADDPHKDHRADASANAGEANPEKPGGGMMGRKKMGAMMQKHKQVEQRLDMLERMLLQLIEHEAIERELEQE